MSSEPRKIFPYHPEVRTWWGQSKHAPESLQRTFNVTEQLPELRTGILVARIVVADRFDVESAVRIANLMSHAPRLWRRLRRMNRDGLDSGDDYTLRMFVSTVSLLDEAAGRQPYGPPADPADESMFRRWSAKAVGMEGGDDAAR